MKVKDLMTADPRTCAPGTDLAAAANLMWEGDCGFLPVVDEGRLVGAVTDRDLFVALATRNRLPSQLTVGEVAQQHVFTCEPEDDVRAALATMREHRVRRLPVVGFGGSVLGVLSLNDLARAAGPRKPVRTEDLMGTLQAIGAHHQPVPHVVAA